MVSITQIIKRRQNNMEWRTDGRKFFIFALSSAIVFFTAMAILGSCGVV